MIPHSHTPQIHVLGENEFNEWDSFVDESMDKCPFSQIAWLKAFASTSPRNSFSIAVLRSKTGAIVAGMTVLVRRTPMGSCNAVVPTLHPYNTFVFRKPDTQEPDRIYRFFFEATKQLMDFSREQGFGAIRFIHHPGILDMRPFAWDGWKVTPAYTFHIDLLQEDIIRSFTGSHRRRYKRCQESGFAFKSINGAKANLPTVLEIYHDTYTRKGLDAEHHGMSVLPAYLPEIERAEPLLYYEVQTSDGRPAAYQVLVPGKNGVAYAWIAGTRSEFLKSGVTVFLFGEMFKHLKELGFKWFDFGGANTPGIVDFKQGFNGRLIHGFETCYLSTKLYHRVVRAGGSSLHRMRTLLAR